MTDDTKDARGSGPGATLSDALDETVIAIVDAVVSEATKFNLAISVTPEADAFWRQFYYPRYRHAIFVAQKDWHRDRAHILTRARQVGRIAATLSMIESLVTELAESSVGVAPGQGVNFNTREPRAILSESVAQAATAWLECVPGGSNQTSKGPPLATAIADLVARVTVDRQSN